jgi:tol-pal system protein YbgF
MGSVLAIELNELDVSDSSPPTPGYPGSDASGDAGTDISGLLVPASASAVAPSTASGALISPQTSSAGVPVAAQPLDQGANMAGNLYNSGTKAFSERKYQDAIKIFQDFVKAYPQNKLAGNAYFWLGESYYQLKNYNSAITAYQQIIENFTGSNKLQSAMFKQGVSMCQKGQQEAGKIRLNELISKYPNSQEADRARQFLKSNQ